MYSKNVFKSLSLLILSVGISINAFSQNINTPENFPDPNFRKVVERFLVLEPGEEFTANQAAQIKFLICKDKGIKSLTGINFFTNLKVLVCSNNQLTSLNLSNNPVLTELTCSSNQLINLDVSNNIALEYLSCWNNQLTSLNLSNNPVLTELSCRSNQLTNLDVSNCSALNRLYCNNNQLTSLDVSKNTDLDTIQCSYNNLTSLSSFVANEGLTGIGWVDDQWQRDNVDVRYNYIGCDDLDTALSDIQILTERIGEAVFFSPGNLNLYTGFAYEPQKECETTVSDWFLR